MSAHPPRQLLDAPLYEALTARLGHPVEALDAALYVVDGEGRVVFCSAALARLVGGRIEDILGRPSLLLYPADVAPALLMERVRALVGDPSPRQLSTRMRRGRTGTVAVALEASPLQDPGAAPAFLVRVREAESGNAGPNVEYLLRLTPEEADALPYGLIMLDRSGRVIGYNEAESQLSRLDRPSVLGRNFFLEIAPWRARVRRALSTDGGDRHARQRHVRLPVPLPPRRPRRDDRDGLLPAAGAGGGGCQGGAASHLRASSSSRKRRATSPRRPASTTTAS
jgi:PAS domain S-box-containing protein